MIGGETFGETLMVSLKDEKKDAYTMNNISMRESDNALVFKTIIIIIVIQIKKLINKKMIIEMMIYNDLIKTLRKYLLYSI